MCFEHFPDIVRLPMLYVRLIKKFSTSFILSRRYNADSLTRTLRSFQTLISFILTLVISEHCAYCSFLAHQEITVIPGTHPLSSRNWLPSDIVILVVTFHIRNFEINDMYTFNWFLWNSISVKKWRNLFSVILLYFMLIIWRVSHIIINYELGQFTKSYFFKAIDLITANSLNL